MSGKKEIIHCCVDRETYELLQAHCDRTGQTKTMAIRRAVRAYCRANGITPEKGGPGPEDGGDG